MEARNFLFFTGITGLSCPSFDAPGFTVFDDFRLINETAAKSRLVSQYAAEIGSVEASFLCSDGVTLLYQRGRKTFSTESDLFEQFNGFLIAKLAKVENWFNDLWIIKDNSVNHDTGWIVVDLPDRYQVTSNVWHNSYCLSNAKNENIFFTKNDFSAARESPLKSEYGEDVGPIPLIKPGFHGNVETKLAKRSHRFSRYTYLLSGARGSHDLAIKVLLYCSALETLLSNSTTEITHQVAERCARTLGTDNKMRAQIYRSIKSAYAMRSKAVHGATFDDKSLDKLSVICQEIDDVCRQLAKRVIADGDFLAVLALSDDKFSEYWLQKILM